MVAPKGNKFGAKALGTHRNKWVKIMLTETELAEVKEASKAAGQNVCAWARGRMLRGD